MWNQTHQPKYNKYTLKSKKQSHARHATYLKLTNMFDIEKKSTWI